VIDACGSAPASGSISQKSLALRLLPEGKASLSARGAATRRRDGSVGRGSSVDPKLCAALSEGTSAQRQDASLLSLPYTADSGLFTQLVRESVSIKVSSAQMQHLLGVAVRAEPIGGELALIYAGAVLALPRDWPWDSSIEAARVTAQNWPHAAENLGEVTLGSGSVLRPLRSITEAPELTAELPSSFGEASLQALGPRLLRIRRFSCYVLPANSAPAMSDYCFNAALCPGTVPGPLDREAVRCGDCGCAWYCSAACRAAHRSAHAFECQSLRGLRAVASGFEASSAAGEHDKRSDLPDRNKRLLATLLEQLLAKQFSMVAKPEALVSHSAITEDLWRLIGGVPEAAPAACRPPRETRRRQRIQPAEKLLDTARPLVITSDRAHWTVELEGAVLEQPPRPRLSKRGMAIPEVQEPRGFFDVRYSHAHTAASAIRLMSRWVGAAHRSPALREVIDGGLTFCIMMGLTQTRLFTERSKKHAVVAVLAHRMALHIAISQQWRVLAPSLVPPKTLYEQGLQGIDRAQYSAYYAFLKPTRLPFRVLQPLPVICVAWGEQAKKAILAFPKKEPSSEDAVAGNGTAKAAPGSAAALGLCSFLDFATEHLANIQLVDSVQLDVLTGKAVFLIYTEVVENSHLEGEEAWIVLLDASRGMQAIAMPMPAKELRRCAL